MSPRLFLEEAFCEGETRSLSVAHAHYLQHVLRCIEGDEVRVFNGKQGEWRAKIVTISKREWGVALEENVRAQPHPSQFITAYLSPIKAKNLEWALEKITELGVSQIQLVATRRSNVRDVNLKRLRSHLIEASEQCGRCDIPHLPPLQTFHEWMEAVTGICLVGDERPREERIALPKLNVSQYTEVSYFVGPEGGFTPEEFAHFLQVPMIQHVCLGPWILRAETAAVAFASFFSQTLTVHS